MSAIMTDTNSKYLYFIMLIAPFQTYLVFNCGIYYSIGATYYIGKEPFQEAL